jgi:hypothetical protein
MNMSKLPDNSKEALNKLAKFMQDGLREATAKHPAGVKDERELPEGYLFSIDFTYGLQGFIHEARRVADKLDYAPAT